MHDLAEIARIDVTPGIALARQRLLQEIAEHAVFVRLDHVADAQGIDIGSETHGKRTRGLLVDDLGQSVAVHRVDVVVLLERKRMIILVALGEADAVCCLARRNDHLADPELHRRLDDVVGARHVGFKRLVVRLEQNARHRGEMDDRIDRRRTFAGLQSLEIEMHRQRVEHLPAVGQVGIDRGHARTVERLQVEVENVVALRLEPGHDVPAGLAGPARKDNALHAFLRKRPLPPIDLCVPRCGDSRNRVNGKVVLQGTSPLRHLN